VDLVQIVTNGHYLVILLHNGSLIKDILFEKC